MNLNQAPPPDLSPDDLRRVVVAFYERAQADPMLGPVFAAHVSDWPAHLDKMTRFWCAIMLGHREYQGNPRAVHAQVPELERSMFLRWLELFDQTASEVLPPTEAKAVSDRAHIMGRSMSRALGMAL